VLAVILVLSILIGVSLGLFGGGGATLTVPILTYVAGMTPNQAIASSLFVVAVTSAAGLVGRVRLVRWRIALGFGAAGMVGSYAGGRLAVLFTGRALMIMFGLMMAAAAIAMLRGRRAIPAREVHELPALQALVQGMIVGAVSGLVGAGGGFLVVPALVLLGGIAIEGAIATSLVVIAMQSLAGFVGHLGHVDLDWPLTLAVTAVAVAGASFGGALARRISATGLRRGFALLVIAMAAFVLLRELVLPLLAL
jgi:hypothetical protein